MAQTQLTPKCTLRGVYELRFLLVRLMSDVKISSRRGPKRKRGGTRSRMRRTTSLVSQPVNTMVYRTSFQLGPLSSGTTGAMAESFGLSISSSSEYSTLQNIFTEVRLISAVIRFAAVQSNGSTTTQGIVWIGTNLVMNGTTFTLPSAVSNVSNCTRALTFPTNIVRPFIYVVPVPPALEFSNLTADAPATVTPWAGSPGVVQMWADHLTNSTAYLMASMQCTYLLRGRQ